MIAGVRQFKLKNSAGEEYDMTRPESLFHSPTGLGWGEEATVQNVGITFITTKKKPKQPKPTGEMVFRDYKEYENFLQFCQTGGLVLCYRTVGAWRYLDVSINIEKTEIKPSTRHLVCPVQFTGNGYWYEEIYAYQTNTSAQGKVYPYTYPYTYAGSHIGSVDVKNGLLESFTRVIILGPVTNPRWIWYKGDTRLAEGKIFATIPEGHRLVIDSDPDSMEIAEYTDDNQFVVDRYGDSDFTTQRLFIAPPGALRVAFTQDGTEVVKAFVEVKKRV